MIAIITLMFVLCIDGIPLRFDNFDTLKLKHRLLQRKTSALSSDLEQHEHLRSEIHGRSCGHSLIAHLQQLSVDDFRVFASKEGISTAPPRSIRLTGETGESRNITNQPGDDHAQGNLQKRVLRGSSSSTSSPATSGPSTIRIVNDFQFASSQLSQSQQNAVQLAVTTAVNIVKKFVKVTSPLTSPLLVRAEVMCNPGTINSTLRAGKGAGVPGADLYLIVTAQSGGTCSTNSTNPSRSGAVSGTLAWAMACDYSLQAGSIGRPILSVINLCPGGVQAAIQAVEASGGVNIKGGVMDVLVHEMMHALGLSSTMYSSWLSQSSGTPYANGGTVASGSVGTYLTTPNSLSQAQQTLNCSSLAGLPLEEEGSRGSALSHWEFRFFYQELMTPFLFALGVQRQRLSSITTAALQDTGWYTPRVEYVMPLDVQQVPAMGCSLALNSCAAYQESFPDTYYCSPGSSGTQQQEAVGDPANLACYTSTDPAACDVTPFSDNCGLLHPANLPCSSSYLGSQLPPGSTNLLSALSSSSSFSAAQDFYVSFGAAYGPDAVCLPWKNSSGGDLR
ncbi:hypothetical protein CEUSTIGMA_g8511.t1 [Chlamydomonas eustigma]|uniref:Peptidase M11 gametolysin domain-containing protein n=1 Tax=Chlamydomonas eustigma TaxID=1157962 RepID=A0A250XDE2_9CHLO|nr:hypothetical protein CEUSTIGMA_g8511.t1 [Chlamydomonas eustigma]|eukprot:GAX81076.1 hypothetical protein CEUSTIGMA_g8511.t1 [Chlamydomonas eustigma]